MPEDSSCCSDNKCSRIKDQILGDPDCLHCLRKKLRAVSVGVFFRSGSNWRLDRFEGDKPYEAAEVEFQQLLWAGVPDAILARGKSFFLPDDAAISRAFPKVGEIFKGQCVIAAEVHRGSSHGVRIAWRDQSDPFSAEELVAIQCEGQCPEGCA